MPAVNPEILQWARTTAGMLPEIAAHKLDIGDARGVSGVERLAALEDGTVQPTPALLRRMAEQYRRPLVSFYLKSVPRKGNRGEDFRTLPEQRDPGENALLDALLRDLKTRQGLLRAALEDDEDTRPLAYIGSATQKMGVQAVGRAIATVIGFSRDAFRSARNPDVAFKELRANVENVGIYVLLVGNLGNYLTTLSVNTFRGIALADPIAPFVVINAGDAKTAWSFTLLHELAHLWLGASGVSGPVTADIAIERFCNDVASEMLVPSAEIEALALPRKFDMDAAGAAIENFAAARNVSRSMVAYKLYRGQRLSAAQWESLHQHYRELWVQQRERRKGERPESGAGPNPNVVLRSWLGPALLDTTKRLLRTGDLSTTRASKVLGIKPTRVGTILQLSEPPEQRRG
ncbi:MAG: ImmA/IrrE family metallo-endopeptidase [Rhodanobacter sp.]|nr:MAG: ImmA/IrrE family metallo-endopeptidase [Rhodanobacter sp.]